MVSPAFQQLPKHIVSNISALTQPTHPCSQDIVLESQKRTKTRTRLANRLQLLGKSCDDWIITLRNPNWKGLYHTKLSLLRALNIELELNKDIPDQEYQEWQKIINKVLVFGYDVIWKGPKRPMPICRHLYY